VLAVEVKRGVAQVAAAAVAVLGTGDLFWGHGTVLTADGDCPFRQHAVPFDQSRDVWIGVPGGSAQWAVSSCGGSGSVPPPPTTTPPATGFAFPYADFWAVPQLGEEPVHGSGCGGDGSIGDTIPDGLWYGRIEALDDASVQFDLMCMYLGEVGERLGEESLAENPDYGSPPYWPGIGFLVNYSQRTRAVAAAPTFVVVDANWSHEELANWPAGGAVTECVPPVDPAVRSPLGPDAWRFAPSWLSIEGGRAQWALTECPHD
jgi:hypothetical protein